jgi:hypothetical protein
MRQRPWTAQALRVSVPGGEQARLEPLIRVVVEFDDTNPVSGRVGSALGPTIGFAGWLDLITVLQTMQSGIDVEARRA